jgi:hypothetical protein
MAMGRRVRFETSILTGHRLLSLWLFGDVAYAVLPIIVLAVITRLLGAGFDDFLLIKEWSFATIVMFGVSIRKLIRLKIEVQQTPRSYKLDTGVQLYIMLLIATVLVLSLVILLEKGILPERDARILGLSQIALFLTGLSSILVAVWVEEAFLSRASRLPKGISRNWLLRRLNWQLDRAANCIDYVLYVGERFPSLQFSVPTNSVRARRDEERHMLLVLAGLERLDELLAAAKRRISLIKDRDAPSATLPPEPMGSG